jgi:hypothetical protein
VTCERCGSPQIVRVRSNRFQRFLRFFTGRKKFYCRRCGWNGLRAWDERDPMDCQRPVLKAVDAKPRGELTGNESQRA